MILAEAEDYERLRQVEWIAIRLHALLTGSPRHTADSAPVQTALKALGKALGVEERP